MRRRVRATLTPLAPTGLEVVQRHIREAGSDDRAQKIADVFFWTTLLRLITVAVIIIVGFALVYNGVKVLAQPHQNDVLIECARSGGTVGKPKGGTALVCNPG